VKVISFTQLTAEGQSVRWFVAEGNAREQLATASRNKVEFHRDDVPPEVVDAAHGAHRELRRNPHTDLRHYATHVEPKDGE
jgi:hypothetical protein